MTSDEIGALCETGQAQLMRMEYLAAEATLAQAEQLAWQARDWDALCRLYMPLQEARRQRRQRCGEGIVCLDLVSQGPLDVIDPMHVVGNFAHGQLLVAGWGTIVPAVRVRELAHKHELYLDTFLGAAYPSEEGTLIALLPMAEASLPPPNPITAAELEAVLPFGAIVLRERDLPKGPRHGTFETYGEVMAIWERLHRPFLIMADKQRDPILRMHGYLAAILVDYACELAHQKFSDVARSMMRTEGTA